jgi:hypothetical protein
MAHPGAVEAHPGAMEAQTEAVEARPGALEAFLFKLWTWVRVIVNLLLKRNKMK